MEMEGAELVPNLKWLMAAQAFSSRMQGQDGFARAVDLAERLASTAREKRSRSDSAAALEEILKGDGDLAGIAKKYPYASEHLTNALLSERIREKSEDRAQTRREKEARFQQGITQENARFSSGLAVDQRNADAQAEQDFAVARAGAAGAQRDIAASAPFVAAGEDPPEPPPEMTAALPVSRSRAQNVQDPFALPPQEPRAASVQPRVTAEDLEAMLNEQGRNEQVLAGPGMAAAGQRVEARDLASEKRQVEIERVRAGMDNLVAKLENERAKLAQQGDMNAVKVEKILLEAKLKQQELQQTGNIPAALQWLSRMAGVDPGTAAPGAFNVPPSVAGAVASQVGAGARQKAGATEAAARQEDAQAERARSQAKTRQDRLMVEVRKVAAQHDAETDPERKAQLAAQLRQMAKDFKAMGAQ